VSSVEKWLTELSAGKVMLYVIGVVAFCLLVRITRWGVRLPWVSHLVWVKSRPLPLGAPRRKLHRRPYRKPLEWVGRRFARVVTWYAGRPLLVKPFDGGRGKEAVAVSAGLSSAMTRIASVRCSGVDSVTAPVKAETTTEAVADGVKGAPAGGELAAALLRLSSVAFARGALQLNGHVLPPSVGGPGLALTLAKGDGGVIERVTIRAADFEPSSGIEETVDPGEVADRMLRLATAGAVWTHFKVLEEVWRLTDRELEKSLRTRSWRSYALVRIGIEGEEHHGPAFTRALYARAVEGDSRNLVAQFNLASLELKEAPASQVRVAGGRRLALVHRRLHMEHKDIRVEHGGSAEDRRMQELLNRDPLCYQVCYKRIAATLNDDIALEARNDLGPPDRPPPGLGDVYPYGRWRLGSSSNGAAPKVVAVDGVKVSRDDLKDLTEHLQDLELTLKGLEERRFGWWPASHFRRWAMDRSKQRAELKRLLVELEGPMLVLWAMLALRLGDSTGSPLQRGLLLEPPFPQPEPFEKEGSVSRAREWLLKQLEPLPATHVEVGWPVPLTPGGAVGFARSADVSPSSRTRLNLACWYADVNRKLDSMREVALGTECGGESAEEWLSDLQLRRLSGAKDGQRTASKARSDTPSGDVSGNGHHDIWTRLGVVLGSLTGAPRA